MRSPAFLSRALPILILGALVSPAARAQPPDPPKDPDPPDHEFRAVFVATAYNLDWPSRSGLHPAVQRDEIKAIVSRVKELNCNVILLQVRAFGDRIHRNSTLTDSTGNPNPEPWSRFLNDYKDPDPQSDPAKRTYDPLAEWIWECHDQGIELHAWITPFRVDYLTEFKPKPHRTYIPAYKSHGDDHLTLKPDSKHVQDRVKSVVEDLLNYMPARPQATTGAPVQETQGVDGFIYDHEYPGTPPASGPSTAPTNEPNHRQKERIRYLHTRAANHPALNDATLDPDELIKAISGLARPKGLKFGVSPGCDAASEFSKKCETWLAKGWVDYVVPELYSKDPTKCPFEGTLQQWRLAIPASNPKVLVIGGLFTTRCQVPDDTGACWTADDIAAQITVTRQLVGSAKRADGQAYYSWSSLRSPQAGGPSQQTYNIGEKLKSPDVYDKPALVPQCIVPPPSQQPPGQPTVALVPNGAGRQVTWQPASGSDVVRWAVWLYQDGAWGTMQVFGRYKKTLDFPNAKVQCVAVKTIDRYNRESDFARSAFVP